MKDVVTQKIGRTIGGMGGGTRASFDMNGVNNIAISVTSRRLVRGMKVDHKKRRGEGLRVSGLGGGGGGGGCCGLSLVRRRQASTDRLEFLGALDWVLEGWEG